MRFIWKQLTRIGRHFLAGLETRRRHISSIPGPPKSCTLLARALLLDQFELLAPEDKTYYRERTRRKFGVTLEYLCQDPDDSIVQLNKILSPLQQVLKRHDFLGRAAPGYGDYIVFGAFQWARVASKRQVIEHNCPVAHWFSRLLNAFNGFAASQPDRSYWD